MDTLTYGVFSRPKQEGRVSGDAYLFQEGEGGTVLCAVVDGLGSGEEAALAARRAIECVQEKHALPLLQIVQHCHTRLKNTRGVVMGLLRVDLTAGRVHYVGVGNVGLCSLAQVPFRPISYNGIVGYRLPHIHEFIGPYHPGDIFVLYSDGIDSRFHGDEVLLRQEQDLGRLAEAIARRYGKEDDICVLVVR